MRTAKLSHNYVSRQLDNYLTKKNAQLLQKIFAGMKAELLEEVYSGKILAIAQHKKSTKLVKEIFKFLRLRVFESKRINIKCKNLVRLRRLEYGERLLKKLKDWTFISHHRRGISEQAKRLYAVSLM